ncbi:MAG: molybdate ABC transporter substrate-binding protein [Synergistales bacterium]|nr:molybdate ABC transporter substrate-binding protein [Synergistales bacterium]
MRRFFGIIAVLVLCGLLAGGASAAERTLTLYCGAGLMHPMDELIAAFEERHDDVRIRPIYAGSGELFGMIATRERGDVYVPGSEKYTRDAIREGMVFEEGTRDLCYHVPVILVPAGNPGDIHSLQDLTGEGVEVALCDAKAAAIGKVADKLLAKNNLLEAVEANCSVRPSTTNQLLIYTATDQVDAVIAWEDQALWGQSEGKVEIVQIAPELNTIKTIPASVVAFTEQRGPAQAYVDFISSPEGRQVWKKHGFPIEMPQ